MLRIATNAWPLLALIALLGGCGSESANDNGKSTSGVDKDDDDSDDDDDDTPKKDAGSTSKSDKKDSGTSTAKKDSGTSKVALDAGTASGGDIPCAVAKVVEGSCQTCHGDMPAAPFSLLTLDDFHAKVPGEEALVYDAAYAAVNTTGPGSMPPASGDPLSAADKKTISDWLKGGAKGGAACTGGSTTKSDAGTVTPITGGSGAAHIEPVKYDDPQMKCYEFRSFASPTNLKQPYSVPTQPDLYVAFDFDPPWQGTQYVRSIRTLIDNTKVIHHWLFFQQSLSTGPAITPNAVGAHPDGQMLAGWAPGGTDLYFDPDVALEVPGDVNYQLEVHYNNKTGAASPDASGVELCVTPTKPTHVAALSWVGTDAIAGTEATGHCAPDTTEDIHLIQAQPHMHTKGRHMKVELVSGGKSTLIHDKDFDFNFQRGYIMDTIIKPGDELYTTCSYSEFATFGKSTNDEMCYFFSIYWPKGALQSVGVGTVIHGVNSCIDI